MIKKEGNNMFEKFKCYPEDKSIKNLFRTNFISRQPIYAFLKNKSSDMKGTIVDFGCGNMPYRDLFINAEHYIGLDVDTAKTYGFNANGITYYDGKNIPFDDESVDCIISMQVFEHIEDLEYTLKEIRRVLYPGGVLCFTCPMVYPIHYMPYDFRRFTNYGIMAMLERHGFNNIEISGSNRMIDTVRYLKISRTIRPFRKLYALYANLLFLYGNSGMKQIFDNVENRVRKILGRSRKVEDLMELPLNYFVFCKKSV